MIPYGKQCISDEDIQAVVDVLKSDWLTQGPKVPEFEQAVANYCNAQYAVAVNSATSALHIACLALGVKSQSLVWTSPISFVASANCALYCGASIDFVDIDIKTGNLCISALEKKFEEAHKSGKLPDVIIPVHFAGQSCDMASIKSIADKYGTKIIEDASHAIGGKYKQYQIGSCQYSDICIFSFHPVKIITSAEGGMALTNNPELNTKLKMLRSHGITSDATQYTEPSHGVWYYQQQVLGFNYRMTDMNAALGLSQLSKISDFIESRNKLASNYNNLFNDSCDIIPLTLNNDCYSSYHLYVVNILGLDSSQHQKIVKSLRERGMTAHVHYTPIYLQPFYKNLGFEKGYCPNAEIYYQTAITLPLFPTLTEQEQNYIAQTLKNTIKELALIPDK